MGGGEVPFLGGLTGGFGIGGGIWGGPQFLLFGGGSHSRALEGLQDIAFTGAGGCGETPKVTPV